jgi:hypothetical protein
VAGIIAIDINSLPAQNEIPPHLQPLKKSLEARNFETYLSFCAPEIREQEKNALQAYFQIAGMESLSIFFAGESQDSNGLNRAFFQVLFQNRYSAIIEIWQISYQQISGGLRILGRTVNSSLANLYRLRFPGERSLSVRNVLLLQKDIRINFSEADIFFDNLPEIDTALIIVGRGQVHFQPSDEIERNQLVRLYKKPFFEDNLEYVYLRASQSFFQNNLSYESVEKTQPTTPPEIMNNLVYSIFSRNYPRSFTVENSLTRELLTFLPQSDETVIEMKTAKRGEFTYVFSPFAEEETFFFDRTHNRLLNSYSPVERETSQKRLFVRFGEKFEIKNYQLEVSYKPENNLMAARVGIDFVSRTENLDSLQLRFNPELQILKIQDEKGRELYYTQDRLRKFIYVYLAEKINYDQNFHVQIFYRGKIVPPSPVTDSLPQKISEEPRVVFSAPQGTFLFAQSAEWYPAPVKEKYFTFRLRLIVPDDYYCLASGQLLERYSLKEAGNVTELENLGNSVFVYESQIPVKYVSFFIGRLKPGIKIQNGLTLEYFSTQDWRYPEKDILKKASDVLETYQRYFGRYLFPKLSIVQRYWNTGGGNSPPGFIVLNELPFAREPGVIIISPNSPVDLSYWKEYYLAHEIAHQWWGHGVTGATYRDNWLTEGLAQFSAAFYLQERYGQKELEKILRKFSSWVRKKSGLGPISLGVRLSHIDFEGYQAIVYNKAALALFMLKDLLGDEVFFRGLQEFYRSHLFQAVRTGDFRLAMEKVSGQDLKKFFQGWFYSENLPEVKVEKRVISSSGITRLELRIRQVKRVFVFPLEIIIETGREKISRLLIVEKDDQTFNLELSSRVKKLSLNPGNKVPGKFE